ncbi:MAG TPA: hypothetical protein VKB40_00790 [Candidatus Acidoferrales bacterium]|nr:hypothetical protein [Candidatus Acidoferrales bacterium]
MPLPEQFKKAYQILSWVSLAGLVVVIVLVLRKSPAPDVPNDPSAAARAEQKLQAADLARAAGRPAQVALDRTELNSYLAENLQVEGARLPVGVDAVGSGKPRPASAPAGGAAATEPEPTLEDVQSSVKDVKVDMEGDVVKAYVLFDFHGKEMTLELDGHLSSEGGYIKFEPISGMLGSMPLPQSMLNSAVEKMMASPENREKLRLPPDVNAIKIEDGHAVMTYK